MQKIDWKSKLCSRKFWALVAGFIGGLVVLIAGTDPTVTISGVVMSLGSIVAFILGEAWVDAANAGSETTNTNVAITTTSKETAEKVLENKMCQ